MEENSHTNNLSSTEENKIQNKELYISLAIGLGIVLAIVIGLQGGSFVSSTLKKKQVISSPTPVSQQVSAQDAPSDGDISAVPDNPDTSENNPLSGGKLIDSPTNTPTISPTAVPTPAPTNTPTPTVIPTPIPTVILTPTMTPYQIPTVTPVEALTPTVTPTP